MRIAIVDDSAEERELLKNRLENLLQCRDTHAELFEYENGEAFLDAAKEQSFCIVFLDVCLNGKCGIDTAKQLRSFDTDCLLIFTSSSPDHALEAFQVRAIHYLVKPYSEHEVGLILDEILLRLPESDRFMVIKTNGVDLRLQLREIVYAEHFSHMIHIHTSSQKELIMRQTFREFIEPLQSEQRFFLCARGAIVNLEHVVDFDDTSFSMDEGSKVAVSRKLVKSARHAYMEYLFQNGHK